MPTPSNILPARAGNATRGSNTPYSRHPVGRAPWYTAVHFPTPHDSPARGRFAIVDAVTTSGSSVRWCRPPSLQCGRLDRRGACAGLARWPSAPSASSSYHVNVSAERSPTLISLTHPCVPFQLLVVDELVLGGLLASIEGVAIITSRQHPVGRRLRLRGSISRRNYQESFSESTISTRYLWAWPPNLMAPVSPSDARRAAAEKARCEIGGLALMANLLT